MIDYEARVQIEAVPRKVWDVLVDTVRWTDWTPHGERIEGELRQGSRVQVYGPLSSERPLPVDVLEVNPPAHLIFRLRWWFVLRAVREVRLERDGGGTLLTLNDRIGGLLPWLARHRIPDLSDQLAAFGYALKRRVEA